MNWIEYGYVRNNMKWTERYANELVYMYEKIMTNVRCVLVEPDWSYSLLTVSRNDCWHCSLQRKACL